MANINDSDRLGDLAELLIQAKALADVQEDDLLSAFVVRALFRTGQLLAKDLNSQELLLPH